MLNDTRTLLQGARPLATRSATAAAATVRAATSMARREPDVVGWPTSPRPPLAVVLGGGALYGTAWHMSVIRALTAAGVDLADVPLVGTSAGSWVAVTTRLGIPLEALHDLPIAGPDRRPGMLADFARGLFGETYAPGVTVCAVEAASGRRRLLDAGAHHVHDLVAASSAIPGIFAPHRVDGRLFVDGGLRSPCSVSVLPAADTLVVSLPLRGLVSAAAGRAAAAAAQRSIDVWRRTHGGKVIVMSTPQVLSQLAGTSMREVLNTDAAIAALPAMYAAAVAELAPHAELLRSATGAALTASQ